MSLTFYLANLRRGKGGAGLGHRRLGVFHSQLSAKRGARVALPQSPILRVCAENLEDQQNQKNEKKSVTSRLQSVTYVLNQECYRCPDCANPYVNLEP